jgi:capsular polysaccharide biosynthesis protein
MQELDIRAIVSALLSKIKLILLATVVLALAFGLYAKFFIKSTYRSEVQLYVSNYNDLTNTQGASTGGLTASQVLVNEYIVILQHEDITNKVAAQLREQGDGYVMTSGAISGAVSMASVGETAMLKITATTTDPALSKAICDAYSVVAPEQLRQIMEMGTIKPMGNEAKLGVKVGPNVVKKAILGGIIGLVLSCAVVLLFYMMDNTVTGERELKRRLNVTVLGEVPSLQPEKKGEKKNVFRK